MTRNPSELERQEQEQAEYTGPVHYFASNAFGWGTGETRAAAIERCIQAATTGEVKRQTLAAQKRGNAGFYIWSCKVHGESTEHYRIEWYMPKGIDISEALHHDVTYITAKALAYTSRTEDYATHGPIDRPAK